MRVVKSFGEECEVGKLLMTLAQGQSNNGRNGKRYIQW